MHISDLRGVSRLLVDASTSATDIVEGMHRTIQLWRPPLGSPTRERTRGITGLVYRGVRGGMSLAGKGVDLSLAGLAGLLPESSTESTPGRDAFLAVVNGVYGDYLERMANPLAIEMETRDRGCARASGRLLVLVHGLCMNERQWTRRGHDHGAALSESLGCAPIYVRYNSGLRVAENGRALAEMIESLVGTAAAPVEEIFILGFSMGGLVARSACHHASESGLVWPSRLSKLVFLGTPHHGALLERIGVWVDAAMECSPYSEPLARIGKARSAGINDLCHGSVTSGTHEAVPLPDGVACYAAAATRAPERSALGDRLVGDGLVTIDSALGRHRDSRHDLAIPESRQWIGYEMGHLDLLDHPGVIAQLDSWLQ